jgi:chemotaxis signal transduction protein
VVPNQLRPPPQTVGKSPTAMVVQVFPLESRTIGLLDDSKLFTTFQGSLTQ